MFVNKNKITSFSFHDIVKKQSIWKETLHAASKINGNARRN